MVSGMCLGGGEMVREENWSGVARMTVSKREDWAVWLLVREVRLYVEFGSLDMERTDVLRWVVMLEDELSMWAKMRQLPPWMDIAPDVAMQTIVSRPWM